MRVDQRRSLHRTILTVAVLLLSASAVAGPGGDYLGQGTWRRNTTTFYDAKEILSAAPSPSGFRPASLVAMAPSRAP